MSRQGIMLCYPFEPKRLTKWGSLYILQPKLDGDRCRAIIDSDGRATLLSSEENVIVSVPHINSALENLHLHDVELDGELYVHGTPHEDIHSIVSREVNIHDYYKMMEYHIFDKVSNQEQVFRILDVKQMFEDLKPAPCLQRVKSYKVETFEDIMRKYDEILKDGYEGFVIRNPSVGYVRKRSVNMMKFKPKKEDSYLIIGYQEEIDQYSSPKGTLGALICQGDDNTRFNVGSGSLLTRDNRVKLWQERETLIGCYANIQYQHLTSTGKVPRFPVIVSITNNMAMPESL